MDFKADSYRVEDLKLLNMKTYDDYVSNASNKLGCYKIFEIENQLSEEQKIEFIDDMKNRIATYLLKIFLKWESEKDTLPKDRWGEPKIVSKKAWIKRNDTRKLIDISYEVGSYHLFGTEYKRMDTICPNTRHRYDMAYTGKNIVNQWFHDLLFQLCQEEQKYFKEHDTFQIKLKKLRELGNRSCTVFNSKEVNDIVHNRKENVDEQMLDKYIDAYERLEQYIEQISKEFAE